MHGANIKIISGQQVRFCNIYKNTKLKLLKTNAAIWFNKTCKIKQLKPNYIQFKTRDKMPQEVKVLYSKKQNLNTKLNRAHLECANQCNNVWRHIQDYIDHKLNGKMDTLYQKLNQKLDRLTKQNQTIHHNSKNTNTQPRLINLTNIAFTREHNHTLAMGPNYALEKDLKRYINNLIIETENAIRQLEPKIQSTFRHIASTKIKQIMTTNTH